MQDRMEEYYSGAVQRHYQSPLTVKQVDRLARKAQAGDGRAKDKLCETVAGLVEAMAGKYRTLAEARGISRDDLRQAGMLKILEGFHNWNPKKSAFRTFARDTANFGMLNLINSAHLVSMPKDVANSAKRGTWYPSQLQHYSEDARAVAAAAIQTPSSLSSIPENPDQDIEHHDPGFDAVIDSITLEELWSRAYFTDVMRNAIVARVWEEKKFYEIGAEQGITQQCAVNRYLRGIKALKICAGTQRPGTLAERVA